VATLRVCTSRAPPATRASQDGARSLLQRSAKLGRRCADGARAEGASRVSRGTVGGRVVAPGVSCAQIKRHGQPVSREKNRSIYFSPVPKPSISPFHSQTKPKSEVFPFPRISRTALPVQSRTLAAPLAHSPLTLECVLVVKTLKGDPGLHFQIRRVEGGGARKHRFTRLLKIEPCGPQINVCARSGSFGKPTAAR